MNVINLSMPRYGMVRFPATGQVVGGESEGLGYGILPGMPTVDLVDETFIVVERSPLAAAVSDPGRWRRWWPDLNLVVFMDRGLDGIRWSMTGSLLGSCEIWLEPVLDGVLLHHYLRGEIAGSSPDSVRSLPDSPRGWRVAARERRRRALAWKGHAWALKDEMEVGRRPGEAKGSYPESRVP